MPYVEPFILLGDEGGTVGRVPAAEEGDRDQVWIRSGSGDKYFVGTAWYKDYHNFPKNTFLWRIFLNDF